ncbi:hypothetical protein [Salinadaptatus halalkaliphilus]|uniref:hypothetical protein n=1 Tax=Salinadaptatus halalkaliphilus TaxID=2419781 RepID=UPI0011412823|nr:hypothetical protein [Salinadaptatus halalkaliphilus]
MDLGLPTRETERFEVEDGQIIRIEVENNYGFRTHVVLEDPEGEIVLSEGVEDSGVWEFENVTSGRWTVRYDPADDSPQTSGNVEIYLRDED